MGEGDVGSCALRRLVRWVRIEADDGSLEAIVAALDAGTSRDGTSHRCTS
jgi:hypothetical protein